jgi:hypothetical protein
MKKLGIAFLAMMCAACAPVTTKVNVPDIAKSDSLSVSDMRPADEKDKKIFSLLLTSKEYGIMRVGDARLSPTPIHLLQYQAFKKFGDAGHVPNVSVYHFVVYSNAKAQLRSGAIGAGLGGLVGAMIGNAMADHDTMANTEIENETVFNNLSTDEYQRGLFTEDENPQKASVYIVYIETDIGGKKVFTRTISPIKKHGDEDSLAAAVQSAINHHLSRYDAAFVAAAGTAPSTPAVSPAVAIPQPASMSNVDSAQVPAETPAAAIPAVTTPAAAPATAIAAPSAPAAAAVSSPKAFASSPNTSMAQDVATQMGCGAVQANGDSTFVAPCGSYSVLIDCDGGQCRPMHTVNVKKDD